MRNLARLTYAANKAQAWEDWKALAIEAEKMGKFGLASGLEPSANASIKKIDIAISLLRSILESSDPNWRFVLPSARSEEKPAMEGDLIDNAREQNADAKRQRFTLTRSSASQFSGTEHTSLHGKPFDINFSAGYPLFLVREAWNRGLDLEALADGYGEGEGTHGDWSGVRDSSDGAITRMLEAALNFLFPEAK
jgi:hypothetical protein